ncbi:MAG: response regulator transcription factor [Treponema sp.]|nr:response regulator transcription factor [Treponema sp.]
MFRVILAEDDKILRALYVKVLKQNGYDVFEAADGEKALEIVESNIIDLVIADIMMPKVDGYELVSTLRKKGHSMPVLMITAKNRFTDLQLGFLSGTDDYMTKPINIDEMIIRVQALLRRSNMASEKKYVIENTVLDYDSLELVYSNKSQILPLKEFQLLYKLVNSLGRSFTKMQLMDDVWGVDCYTDPHTLEVHVNRLRQRLADNPDIEIITVRGIGYKAVRKNV